MNEFKPLARAVFEPSAETVALALLGHWLIRLTPGGAVGGPIVETEAYLSADPACHAAPGITPRNRVMFGPPGHAYVYFIYGCHYCVNAVCRPAGTAEAVLIRAIEATFDCDAMRRARAVTGTHKLTNGPGKLCEAMEIGRSLNGVDLCDPRSPLFIAENPACKLFLRQRGPVVTTTRIGITRAADLPLRFYLGGSAFVSRKTGSAGLSDS
jgi:DNA-3-methyladenine glycosylase